MATYKLINVTLFPSSNDFIKTVPAPLLATPPRHLPTVNLLTDRNDHSIYKALGVIKELWLVLLFSLRTSLKGWSIKHWWRNWDPEWYHQHDKSLFPWIRHVINSSNKILWGWLSFHINNKGIVRAPSTQSMKVIGVECLSKLHQ